MQKGTLMSANRHVAVGVLLVSALVLGLVGESSAQSLQRSLEILATPDTPTQRPQEIAAGEWGRAPGGAWNRLRVEASQVLIQAGARAAGELVALLAKTRDDRVRISALSCLSQMNAPGDATGTQAVPALQEVAPQLAKYLNDPNPGVKYLVIKSLGRARHDAALDVLHRLAADEEMAVRLAVADALGLIGSPRSEPTVLKLMDDEEKPVRLHAIQAVGQLGPMLRTVPKLIELLQKDDVNERNAALDALHDLTGHTLKNDGRWLLALTAEQREPLIEEVRAWWKKTLGEQPFQIPGEAELTLRVNILAQRWQPTSVKLSALRVLDNRRDKRTVDYLILALRDPDPQVRKEVARVVSELSGIKIEYRAADSPAEWDAKVDALQVQWRALTP
jgi:HEAT repeat protein